MNKPIAFVKKHKVSTILLGVVVVLFGWWGVVNVMPHPLGNGMEYLGKRDYGCWVGFCDANPASIYYYGTDMDENQIAPYFAKSKLLQDFFQEDRKNAINIQAPTGETMYIYHYPSSSFTQFKTTKRYIVEIPSFKYKAALEAL